MNDLTKLSCEEFLTKLSSKEPTPGGGAAAALVGATAASLCCMVVNIAKPGKRELLTHAEHQRNELLRLMNIDAKAYQQLSNSYKLPKDHPKRAEAISDNSEQAALIACNIATCCYNVLLIARELQICVGGSISLDADTAETMATASFVGAMDMTYENLRHTNNETLNEVLRNKIKQMERGL